ncbi:MAG: glycogen/starch/alpha-glucan family phosphorylase, partial [Oscillospiraceae bacterium]
IKKHLIKNNNLDNLWQKAVIHINDTHPALCVPELMRLLIDENNYSWEDAWNIVTKTLAYTNHTVMSEALEVWPVDLFKALLPRIFSITQEINRRFCNYIFENHPDKRDKIEALSIISKNVIHMANMCVYACFSVNGVSKLHSDILKNDLFKDYNDIFPCKITNVTNGIAHRRWLCQSNPLLSDYLSNLIGSSFEKDLSQISKLNDYVNDEKVLTDLMEIKYKNKVRLAKYIEKANGIIIDPNSIFDVQVKRLHEYKRQMLNALYIYYLYTKVKFNGEKITPRTFIFGAKASPGYVMAKEIIRFICALGDMINNDSDVRDFIKVIFISDYKVSLAEIIMPAADVSEQISQAGKEASGTGNMKLMLGGAVTIGTMDGANVEIFEQVGAENIFIFGMTTNQVNDLASKGYNPKRIYECDNEIKQLLDSIKNGAIMGKNF